MYNVSEGHTLLLCFSKRWPSGNHKKWLKNQLKPAFQTGERWWQPIKPDEYGDQAFRFSITFTFSFSHLQSGERWWRRMETRWAWQPWVRQGEHKDHVMIYWQFFWDRSPTFLDLLAIFWALSAIFGIYWWLFRTYWRNMYLQFWNLSYWHRYQVTYRESLPSGGPPWHFEIWWGR